ncbi:MAG TPA: dockerin type I domain-containing protein [Bacteroidales bacterium]|nr:dockerin type I domain-containing protein [Bacteroidales bacterium]HSA43846.1 dockerin type I domain-containing protein [Bacteroidales bacterium]
MKRQFYFFLSVLASVILILGNSRLQATEIDSLTAEITHISCFGYQDGAIDLTVHGGIAPYTYFWNDGYFQEDRINLPSGNYSVTVHDQDGHYASAAFQLGQPGPLFLESAVNPVTCYGGNNGSIDATVFGGTSPYTYLWSNGSTEEDPQNLTAGVYTFTLTDAQGCELIGNVLVPGPDPSFTVTLEISDVNCYNGSDGAINLSMQGGTPPYTFLWNDGFTGEDRTGLIAGNYDVSVYDAAETCSAGQAVIVQPDEITWTDSIIDVNCSGVSNGSILIEVDGGTTPYSFLWSNGSTMEDLLGAGAGTYYLTITDANNCAVVAGPYTLTDPTPITISWEQGEVSCHGGNDGFIDITATGGFPPYSFAWSNGATSEDLQDLMEGYYSVTVTDSVGCTVSQFFLITQPESILANGSVTNVSCFGLQNGSIVLSTTGGTPPYSYLWNTGALTDDLFALAPGTYTVTITDAENCTLVQDFTVTQPDYLWCGGLITDIDCPGDDMGNIELGVFGGTPPYSYLWNDGVTTKDRVNIPAGIYSITVTDDNSCHYSTYFVVSDPDDITFNPSITHVSCLGESDAVIELNMAGGTAPFSFEWNTGATSNLLSGLPTGIYSVSVTDQNGCTADTSFVVTEPPLLTISGSASPAHCFGNADGLINTLTEGGTQPYAWLWSDGGTEESRDSIVAGDYTVTVTDANGCTATADFIVSQPEAFAYNETITHVSCNGLSDGAIVTAMTGGTQPYSYAWSTGEDTPAIDSLITGEYTLTVTDQNSCETIRTFTIEQPDVLYALITVGDVSCFNGSDGQISVTTMGGTTPYAWLWSNGAVSEDISGLTTGMYYLTITDVNGCIYTDSALIEQPAAILATASTTDNICFGDTEGSITVEVNGGISPYSYLWNDGETNLNRTGLAAGLYSLTITDANLCTFMLDPVITEPPQIEANPALQHVSCNGLSDGSITVTPAGGTPAYTLIWSTGSDQTSIDNLTAGLYSLTITDANNCSRIFEFEITQPDMLLVTGSVTNVTCFDDGNGHITLTVTGGTQPFEYLWNTGAVTADPGLLTPGLYEVTVTDANGCTDTENFTITQPDALQLVGLITPISCVGAGNGIIDVNVFGGTMDYTYLWNTGAVSQDLSNLTPGTYQITVTDAQACQAFGTFNLADPALIVTVTATPYPVSCYGDTDGGINLDVSGGNTPYLYSWNTGYDLEDLSGVGIGTYTVTVTDNDGACTVVSGTVTQPDPLDLSGTPVQTLCFGSSDGSIDITVTGGTPSYTFLWNNGLTDEDITGLTTGTYSVTVTDNNGCEINGSYFIGQPDELIYTATVADLSCFESMDGQITGSTTGGTPAYSYVWDNGAGTETIASLAAGDYTVTVTDGNLCETTATFTVGQPAFLELTVDAITDVLCHNGNNGSIALSTSGGTPDYTYLWSDGATTEDRENLMMGDYSVTVTDSHGCTFNATYTINETFTLIISSVSVPVSCYQGSDGEISVSLSGGTDPYAYLWNDGNTDQNRTGLTQGDYYLTVTDNNGCSETAQITVVQPDELIISGTVTNISCFGYQDGIITTTAAGGNGGYLYLWSGGQTDPVVTDLGPGVFTVTVTDSKGCTDTEAFEVTEPEPTAGYITPLEQTINCNGGAISPITFVPEFYTSATITYNWTRDQGESITGLPMSGSGPVAGNLTNKTSNPVTVTFLIEVTLNGCDAGTFTVTVTVLPSIDIIFTYDDIPCYGDSVLVSIQGQGGTPPYFGIQDVWLTAGTHAFTLIDANLCEVTESVVLTQPSQIQITGTTFPAVCSNQNNAAINLNVSGGTPPYSYLWNDGVVTQNRNQLEIGNYQVTVTDANNCTTTKSFNVGAFFTAPLAYMAASPAGCYGITNYIYVYLAGSPPFNFTYTDGTNLFTVTNVMTNAYTIEVVLYETTTYTLLTVTDMHCSGIVTSQPQTLVPQTPPTASLSPTEPICKGEVSYIQVDFTGTPPFNFTWFDGTPHPVSNILSSSYIITSTPQQTKQYSITNMSDNYCPASDIGFPVLQVVYPLPTATISGNPTICAGLSVPLQVTFTGQPPWQFTYTDGLNATTIGNIMVPSYQFNVSPSVTTHYSLLNVSDSRCAGTVSGLATVLVHPRPTATWIGPDSACIGGVVTLNIALTGTPPWTLTWNDGTPHYVQNIMFTPYTISAEISATKVFTITQLTDAFCQAVNAQQLGQPKTVSVHQLPTAALTGPSSSCFGVGSALQVSLTGSPPWTVTWFEGTQVHSQSGINTSPFEILIDPATTTTYFLSAITDNFCVGEILGAPVTVSVTPSPVMVIEGLNNINPVCFGASLTFTTNFFDGVPPFTVNYFDHSGTFHSIPDLYDGSTLTFTAPGATGIFNYILASVSGSNGCELVINQNFSLQVIPAPIIDAGPDSLVSLGNSIYLNGSVEGGTAPFDIQWTPATYLNDPDILNPLCTPLADITYFLVVTDSIGCTVSDHVNITIDLSRNIWGYIHYDNAILTPMNNVLVKVKNAQNEVIDSTYSQADGYYNLSDLPNGTFTLHTYTDKPFGGVNSTDALVILKHFVQLQLLTGIRLHASDVDASGFVNAIDALAVAKRFTGQIPTFAIGDWYFEKPVFSIPASVAQYDYLCLCSGDANGSYFPPAKQASNTRLLPGGDMQVVPGQELTIAVTSLQNLETGAISLVIDFPADQLRIREITLADGKPLIYNVCGNQVKISWYDVEALAVKMLEPILLIRAEVLPGFTTAGFSLESGSEIADPSGTPFDEVQIQMPRLIKSEGQPGLSSMNQPNPFSSMTVISFQQQSEGRMSLHVMDLSGKIVARVTDQWQPAGYHQILFDGSSLPEGIYFYQITCQHPDGDEKYTGKMSIVR